MEGRYINTRFVKYFAVGFVDLLLPSLLTLGSVIGTLAENAAKGKSFVPQLNLRVLLLTVLQRSRPLPEFQVDENAATFVVRQRTYLCHMYGQPRRERCDGNDQHFALRTAGKASALECEEEGSRRYGRATSTVQEGDR